jgi:hypothetical protein
LTTSEVKLDNTRLIKGSQAVSLTRE